jgi:hypothetical protein
MLRMRRPKRRPRTVRCRRCKAKIKVRPKGRVPIFCGRNCRQRAYEHNHALRPTLTPMSMLARDLDTVRVRDVIREEVRAILRDMGFNPPPPPRKPDRKGLLRVVRHAD